MFKKKYPPIETLLIDEQWGLSQGTYHDKPIFFRVNKGLKKIIGHPQYPHQVGIAVPLNNPNEHGLPISVEGDQLNVIEDQLVDSLEVEKVSVFAGAISTNGMREFVFYTSNPEQVVGKFKAIQGKTTSHEIQLMIKEDKDWQTYKTMLE